MDLVDEEDVAVVEVGEQRSQVARPLERRPRGDAQADLELVGDDAGHRGLPQAGRAREKDVVDGLAPLPGSAEKDLHVLSQLGLAHELVEAPGPEADLLPLLSRQGHSGEDVLAEALLSHREVASSLRASRSSTSTSPSSGSSRRTSRTSSGW